MFSQRSWTTVSLLFFSPPFILTRIIGRITKYTTFPEGRLGLTKWKRNCLPTGTHPSLRSVSVWRLEISSTLSWLTRRLTLCIHWLLMGNTAQPHWVVTHGKSWLVHRPLCSFIATGNQYSKARIGIIGDLFYRARRCLFCTSRIGFGTGGLPDYDSSCGNEARQQSYNEEKRIRAMGYILVEKQNADAERV